jgi:DNA-binding SARP family transcriptional activator
MLNLMQKVQGPNRKAQRTPDIQRSPGVLYCSMPWQLQVVGGIRLYDTDTHLKPERRSVAILTYLALEGPTPRSKLAGLLWPDVEERPARNNLVQALRRLKKLTDTDLITGDDALKLADELEVDIATLNILAFQSNYEDLLKVTGELLPYDYDDLSEFSDWLLLERDKLTNLRREALTSLIKQNERETKYDVALKYAQPLLHLDIVAEETYRLMMRLHYLAGNRAEAMKAFERCKSVLQKELGVEPSLETHKLAAAIGFGTLELLPTKPKETTLPLSVLRPPALVGREKEWELLEAAWREGKVIFLHGEPGSGKSRLMLDFVASKGDYILIEPRPGDEAVIYSTQARNVRGFLEKYPEEKLEPWIRTELSRLVPTINPEPPPPMKDETAKLRLFEAVTWLTLKRHERGAKAIVMDDAQFIDAGSLEIGNFLVGKFTPVSTPDALRSVNAYRTGEISAPMETMIHNFVNAGTAVLIEVSPLSQSEVTELVESLAVPQFLGLAERLSRYTGGNPFFILETLKSLLESGDEHPEQFPISNRVNTLVQKRLGKLHPTSLKLARVAAVASTDFSPALAETILNMDALELAEPFAELERLQVLQGTKFAHDLIYEATLSGIPAPIKTLLHGRVAGRLETTGSNPARIAFHWVAAGEEVQAVPFLKKAALNAAAQYQLREVVTYATQGAGILEGTGNREGAWEFWEQAKDVLKDLEQGDELGAVIKGLHRTASTPKQLAQSLNAECDIWISRGNLSQAKRIAAQAMIASQKSEDFDTLAMTENNLGMIHWMEGETSKAADHLARSNEYLQLSLQQSIDLGRPEDDIRKAKRELAIGLLNHAVMLDEFGRYALSEVQHKKAIGILQEVRDAATLVQALSNLSITLLDQGRGREALEYLREAKQQEALLTETTLGSISTNTTLSNAHLKLDQYTQALDYAHQARNVAEASQSPNLFVVLVRLAKLYRILGAVDEAQHYFGAARDQPRPNTNFADTLYREYAVFLLEQGEEASEMVAQALSALTQSEHLYGWYKTHLELLSHFSPDERMQLVNETLKKPGLQTIKGLHILALTRGAQTQLELGKAKKALDFSRQAVVLLEHYEPDLQRAEVLLTHYQTLKATKDKGATEWLEQTLTWLLSVADNHVPTEYRESFLTKNPVNKAILDEATRVGIRLSVP